jgi:hypothetical protein
VQDASVYCMSICEDKEHLSGTADGPSVSRTVRLRNVLSYLIVFCTSH